jgi:hypothetical protein
MMDVMLHPSRASWGRISKLINAVGSWTASAVMSPRGGRPAGVRVPSVVHLGGAGDRFQLCAALARQTTPQLAERPPRHPVALVAARITPEAIAVFTDGRRIYTRPECHVVAIQPGGYLANSQHGDEAGVDATFGHIGVALQKTSAPCAMSSSIALAPAENDHDRSAVMERQHRRLPVGR